MPGARCSTIACRSRSAPTSRSRAPTPSPASPPRSAARMRRGSRRAAGCRSSGCRMEQAFAAFTRGAAFAGFAEDRLGTLEPGQMADFIFIDRDIFATRDQREIRATQVLETYVGGGQGLGAALAAERRKAPGRQDLRQHLRLAARARNRGRAARPSGRGVRGSGRSPGRRGSSRRPAPGCRARGSLGHRRRWPSRRAR